MMQCIWRPRISDSMNLGPRIKGSMNVRPLIRDVINFVPLIKDEMNWGYLFEGIDEFEALAICLSDEQCRHLPVRLYFYNN